MKKPPTLLPFLVSKSLNAGRRERTQPPLLTYIINKEASRIDYGKNRGGLKNNNAKSQFLQ